MFQILKSVSRWLSSPAKSTVTLPPRPIRFGSTKAGSKSAPSGRTTPKPSGRNLRPHMEVLEGRATPAHLGGIDIRLGFEDSPLVLEARDWLAQPIQRSSETSFLNMGNHCPKIEVTVPTRSAPSGLGAIPQKLDALLFAGPGESFSSASEVTLSRDELFQTGEWGSNKRDLFASWTGAYGNSPGSTFGTHTASTPDALLMASLAVVGVPLLSMSEKPEEHWEEVLPKRKSQSKKGRRSPK